MSSPLLHTKTYVPPVRSGLVRRPRLADQREGDPRRLTLVSAPPGFGKSTLLAFWAGEASRRGRPVAWVSLEESEQQPASFWSYVVTALEAAVPGLGRTALPLLQGGQPPIRTVLAVVLNDLGGVLGGLDLVLDDYHLADCPAIADDVAFLLEHLPEQVQMIIGTRADPALPMARLRARGELTEVRAADLRFTLDEVASYLNDSEGLDLQATDIAALEGRTEGWIAALQLAALSLHGRADATGFIAGFAGDDRYVVDYLVEEVLARQSDSVRLFLLETSVLERLSAPLCDAVTGRDDGRSVLDVLDRSNLFVVSLDRSRQWFRYHHLFAEVLRTHLLDELPEKASGLHRRAARWFSEADQQEAAVSHALAAKDVELAAELIERCVLRLLRERQEATVRPWLEEIPYDVVRVRPVLAVGFIGALMVGGELASVDGRLADVEQLLEAAERDGRDATGMVVVEETELPRLPAAMDNYRAALALIGGDPGETVRYAERAIARAAPGDHLTPASAAALSGLASWGNGDLEAAHRGYSAAVAGLERAGNYADVLGCSITLADIRITQGRLLDAARTFEDALTLARTHEDGSPLRGTVDMLVGLGLIALEHDDLATAATHLDRVEELGEHNGLPQHPYRWRVARARLREAEGDLPTAEALLEEAEQVYVGDFSPNVRPVPAQRARLLLAEGRLPEALEWARDRDLSADDDLSYVQEYEHVTLARILIHRHATEGSVPAVRAARDLLTRLASAAELGGRTGTLLEVLVLQALAHHAEHGRPGIVAALNPLERALRIAEPERYARLFVDEGPAMVPLLTAIVRADPAWPYPRRLLAGLDPSTVQRGMTGAALVDPLSTREMDVLRMLATDLDGPAIARELVVSLNTVRTHTKSIYTKLGVNSRRAAVSRAGELALLTHRL